MTVMADLRAVDHSLTRKAISWDSPWVRRVLLAVEESAEHTKPWWAAAVVMATTGVPTPDDASEQAVGPRGRRSAARTFRQRAPLGGGRCPP